jgi:type IV secretory pathway VirB10-like protein
MWIAIGGASAAALVIVGIATAIVILNKLPAAVGPNLGQKPGTTSKEIEPTLPEPPPNTDKPTPPQPPNNASGPSAIAPPPVPPPEPAVITREVLDSVKKQLREKEAECETQKKQAEKYQAEILDLKKEAEDLKKYKNPAVIWLPARKLGKSLSLSKKDDSVQLPPVAAAASYHRLSAESR